MFVIFLQVVTAGLLGGFINALLSGSIDLPGRQSPTTEKPSGVWRPGFLSNVLIGATSAVIYWGSSIQFKDYILYPPQTTTPAPLIPPMTLSILVTAILVGTAGSRWITNEVDKKLLKEAVSTAAGKSPDPEIANKMISATPPETLALARALQPPTT